MYKVVACSTSLRARARETQKGDETATALTCGISSFDVAQALNGTKMQYPVADGGQDKC